MTGVCLSEWHTLIYIKYHHYEFNPAAHHYRFTGWAKSGATMFEGPHFLLTSSNESIFTIFGILQCCFIVNTSVDSKFIKFV